MDAFQPTKLCSQKSQRLRPHPWLATLIGWAVAAGLLLVRQPHFPAPWFDEGLNTSTAAMLARTGLYALPDSAGPWVFDPAIQTGPTVIVPVALIFKLFGTDLLQARLVPIGFALLALWLYVGAARRLAGRAAALLAVGMLALGTSEWSASFIPMGRQVLGEVTALAYYLLGMRIWLRTVERRPAPWPGLVLSGLAWGIAMLTKSQVLLLLPVGLGALALLDRWHYRQAGWRAFLVPGAVAVALVGCWYGLRYLLLSADVALAQTQALGAGFLIHIADLEPQHWRNALGTIWRTGFWLWGLPGLAYGMWLARGRSREAFQHAALLAFPLVALGWFALLSIGWARYAFYPLTLAPIWTAALAAALWRAAGAGRPAQRRALACLLIGVYVLAGQGQVIRTLAQPPETGYTAMRQFLQTQLPADTRIEMWEWELSMDAPQAISHPPMHVTNAYTQYRYSGAPLPAGIYDPLAARPDYILEGPYSSWTGIYQPILRERATLVVQFQQYALYRVDAEE